MPNDKINKQLSDEELLNKIGPDDDAPVDLPKQKRAPLKKLKKWFHNHLRQRVKFYILDTAFPSLIFSTFCQTHSSRLE